VVHALHRIHAALEAGGMVVDTQPVSQRPVIEASGDPLGRLDMRDWSRTIALVDERVAQTIDAGLYSVETETRFMVTDAWDSGAECVETVARWQGARIPPALARRARSTPGPLTVDQEVRLRLLRAR
jgi:hypothetical protein